MALSIPPKHAYLFGDPANRGKDSMGNLDIPPADIANVTFVDTFNDFGARTKVEVGVAVDSFVKIRPPAPVGDIVILLFTSLPAPPDALLADADTTDTTEQISIFFNGVRSGSTDLEGFQGVGNPSGNAAIQAPGDVFLKGIGILNSSDEIADISHNFTAPNPLVDDAALHNLVTPATDKWNGLASAGGAFTIGLTPSGGSESSRIDLLGIFIWYGEDFNQAKLDTIMTEMINGGAGPTFEFAPVITEEPSVDINNLIAEKFGHNNIAMYKNKQDQNIRSLHFITSENTISENKLVLGGNQVTIFKSNSTGYVLGLYDATNDEFLTTSDDGKSITYFEDGVKTAVKSFNNGNNFFTFVNDGDSEGSEPTDFTMVNGVPLQINKNRSIIAKKVTGTVEKIKTASIGGIPIVLVLIGGNWYLSGVNLTTEV